MVKILGVHCCGLGSVPGWGNSNLATCTAWQKKKKKKITAGVGKLNAVWWGGSGEGMK